MAREINGKSPTAQRMLKFAFNLTDDGLMGQQVFTGEATRLAYMTDEAVEGRDSFLEKRDPDWSAVPLLLLSPPRQGRPAPPQRPACPSPKDSYRGDESCLSAAGATHRKPTWQQPQVGGGRKSRNTLTAVGTDRRGHSGDRDAATRQQVEVDARDDVQHALGTRLCAHSAPGAGRRIQDQLRAAQASAEAQCLRRAVPCTDTARRAPLGRQQDSEGRALPLDHPRPKLLVLPRAAHGCLEHANSPRRGPGRRLDSAGCGHQVHAGPVDQGGEPVGGPDRTPQLRSPRREESHSSRCVHVSESGEQAPGVAQLLRQGAPVHAVLTRQDLHGARTGCQGNKVPGAAHPSEAGHLKNQPSGEPIPLAEMMQRFDRAPAGDDQRGRS